MRHGLIAITLAFGLFGSAASAQEWGEWHPITADHSLVGFEQISTAAQVEQLGSYHSGMNADREIWQWDTGSMFVLELRKSYMPQRTKKDFPEIVENWAELEDLGIVVTRKDVQRGVNKLGKYFYAEMAAPEADVVCFLFMQNIRFHVPAGYEAPGGLNAGGFLEGFDCQNANEVTAEEHLATMQEVVATFRRQ